MNDYPDPHAAVPKIADSNTAEAVFAAGALGVSIAAVLYGAYQTGQTEQHFNTGAVLLSQVVCVMNFRSWKLIVSMFLDVGKGRVGALDPQAKKQTSSAMLRRLIFALTLKSAAIISSIVFILKTDDRGLLWFVTGFTTYIILGALLLAAHHVWRAKPLKAIA